MTDKYESMTARLFFDRYGLTLRKIPEAPDPTPDFNVYAAGERVAVLEVKALEETALVTLEELHNHDLVLSGLRVDNGAARVATKIHEAVRQLDGALVPKLLVLVNDGFELDKFDLQEALQGFLWTDDGDKYQSMPLSARHRAQQDKSKVDLYVWVDERSGESPQLVTASAAGRALRLQYFDCLARTAG